VLPGQVLAVFSHPDLSGIDYLTGEYDEKSTSTIYHQLYTLQFGDEAPHLLIGNFEKNAYNFAWSFDGHFLSYLSEDTLPGHRYQRHIQIVDLNGCTTGGCKVFTPDTGSQDLYNGVWSPTDYRLALGGVPQDQEFGAGDIFLLTLDAETYQTTLTNLTQSSTIDDWAPVQWTSDGNAILYACSTESNKVNEYSLCQSKPGTSEDEVIAANLPWNMHSLYLIDDQRLMDRAPVVIQGVFRLRTYDFQNDQESTLLEWSATGKYWMDTTVSPDGQWAAAVINDLGGLII